MSVGLLLITHSKVGQAMLSAVQNTFGELPLPAKVVDVNQQDDPSKVINDTQALLESFKHPDGILILTDIFGSTPSNIAESFLSIPNTKLISGVNLPMLIRIMNYPKLDLENLAQKALSGGREGILESNTEIHSGKNTTCKTKK